MRSLRQDKLSTGWDLRCVSQVYGNTRGKHTKAITDAKASIDASVKKTGKAMTLVRIV